MKTKKKDTTTKRMKRGFKVLSNKLKDGYNKVCESEFVKNVQRANDNPNPESMLPKGLMGQEESEDVFSTDFSKLGKTNI